MAIYFSMILFVATICWAALTKVNEITTAEGEAIPSGYIHDIQHLEGGIVSEIAVHNGDQVKPGDLLIRFALPVSQADYEQLQVRKTTLTLKMERLLAIEENRKPNFQNIGQLFADLSAKEMSSYHAQISSTDSEIAILKAQTSQRESELRRQKKYIVSETDLLATQSKLASLQSQLKSVQDGIFVATMALTESKNRHLEILAGHKKDVELEITEVAGQLAEVEKSLIKAEDRVNRLSLFAPISGIIQGIAITSINSVIAPGNVILQIVPTDDEMIIEAKILPEEIGHVHIDQYAEISVDSYDSGKFGHVNGKVKHISPSTYLDDEKKPYYRAHIELEKNYVGKNPKHMKIIPGMTVQVNIITGSKSILDYLLKPVSRRFKNAFQER